MKVTQHISLIFIVLISSFSFAQVKFEAKVSKKTLGVNERLRIDFEMNKDGDNFVPPSFEGFDVVGGPNTSLSNSWINGQRSYKKTYSYFLSPKKKGTFTIKQATVEIDNEIYKTFPITIKVTKAIDKPKNPNDPSYVASEKVHFVTEISNTNPFLNEPISVVYKLYIKPDIGANIVNHKQIPKYRDFWNQNIEIKSYNTKNGTYKGEEYWVATLKKVVLYPQKTGKLTIEPYVLDLNVEVPTNRVDIFGRRQMAKVPQTVTAGTRTINVKSLPEVGKPADFQGAVGDFELKVTTTKTELNATESLQAKIEVSGKGNLKLIQLPKLTVPSSLEVYEPEHNESVRTTLSGMQGKISDSYTIVPQYRGKYPIPSIGFSYFDLKSKTYKRLSSSEIVIDVLEGPTAAVSTTSDNTETATKQIVKPTTNTFAFIKTSTNWLPTRTTPFFKSSLFWGLLGVPFLFIPVAILLRRNKEKRNADVFGNKIRAANKLAKKYLSAAKRALGQKEAFYIALEKAFHNYLKAKLHIETSDFNKEKIESLLTERQVETEVSQEFISILESCELARYTPITQVTMENDYNRAVAVISKIDKQLRS